MTNVPARTGIIAGNGRLPFELAASLRAAGHDPYVIRIENEADPGLEVFDGQVLHWGQIGQLIRLLRSHDVRRLCFVGGVQRRPEFRWNDVDFGTVMALPRVIAKLLGGDDGLLTATLGVFEAKGFAIAGVGEVAPGLLMRAGDCTKRSLSRKDAASVGLGRAVISALGPHDVGQACVVLHKRVVAVEGAEGTDGMMDRVVSLRDAGRVPADMPGCLVKGIKPGQDLRVDLPTIGPETVLRAEAAGLRVIAVEADHAIILERERTIALADERGITIHGFAGP